MPANDNNPFSPLQQPDLEEFLSALSGFLNKQTAPSDPGHLRFLEIFFRSVKSEKGHLLRVSEDGQLRSVVSVGMGPGFEDEFNAAMAEGTGEPSPLDMAFQEKEPVAIVDLSRDPDIPPWFSKLMKKHGFGSMVAVPLMGATQPIGILCAYYQDVCLFDRATLGHLMMIGRMVGGASERSIAAEKALTHEEKEKVADHFLRILTGKVLTPAQIYSLLAKMCSEALPAAGFVCGPVTKTSQGLTLTVAGAAGVSSSIISHQLVLPVFLTTRFIAGVGAAEGETRSLSEWGELKSYISDNVSVDLARPLVWQNVTVGAAIAWRGGATRFSDDDGILMSRLTSIATLALQVRA